MNPAKKLECDAIVANPHFSYRWEPDDTLAEDFRFKSYGLAPKSAAENVDEDGNNIDVEKEKNIDIRQLVTFQTKSGKTLHLIIDHNKNGQNVRLLTEVSEFDLLNMVEENEMKKQKKDDKKEIVKKEPDNVEEKPETTDKNKEDTPIKEKNNNSMYIILALISLGVIGAGYYFKVYKNKKDEYERVADDNDLYDVDDDIESDDSEEDEENE